MTASGSGSARILIVEDSRVQALLLSRILEEAGHTPATANNGQEALEQIASEPPQLVISDINMPIMDGYTMCRTLKNDAQLSHIPVILLSDLSNMEEIVFGLESRADNYILKPYDSDDLLQKVSQLLQSEQTASIEPGEPLPVTIEGKSFNIRSDRPQILRFLLSIYASALKKNRELHKTQATLKQVNENLESAVDVSQSANQKLAISENNYRILVQTVPDIIYQLDTQGCFTFVNYAVEKLGFTPDELIGQHFKTILSDDCFEKVSYDCAVRPLIESDQLPNIPPKLFDERRGRDRKTMDLEIDLVNHESGETMSGLLEQYDAPLVTGEVNSAGITAPEGQGHYLGTVGVIRDITRRKEVEARLAESNRKLNTMLERVERANRKVIDSIQYAKRIQQAILPHSERFFRNLPDSFLLWLPRDIVSGDLYFTEFHSDWAILAVLDCTGHGVPGAFMTMIANASLKQIIVDEREHDPAKILYRLNRLVKEALRQDTGETTSDDGLDASICFIDKANHQLIHAGARLGLFHLRNGKAIQIKGDRMSIGYRRSDIHFEFNHHVISLNEHDAFYMATDGLADQAGGDKGFPFGHRRFIKLLEQNHRVPISEQGTLINDALHHYQGKNERRDDITVIGFQVS
ncbi:MAG: response regulator [Magnetococcales bacterium]|nr:response regulator [Magnetococcales bacterium]